MRLWPILRCDWPIRGMLDGLLSSSPIFFAMIMQCQPRRCGSGKRPKWVEKLQKSGKNVEKCKKI